jgi:Zn finger protein HypA/HybF involved in hydrogenase expression
MTFGNLRNWVWCEDCLEWKDADEVNFVSIEEDSFGKDMLTFTCDKCGNDNKNNIIQSSTRPRG